MAVFIIMGKPFVEPGIEQANRNSPANAYIKLFFAVCFLIKQGAVSSNR
jgi:hypothetical protein